MASKSLAFVLFGFIISMMSVKLPSLQSYKMQELNGWFLYNGFDTCISVATSAYLKSLLKVPMVAWMCVNVSGSWVSYAHQGAVVLLIGNIITILENKCFNYTVSFSFSRLIVGRSVWLLWFILHLGGEQHHQTNILLACPLATKPLPLSILIYWVNAMILLFYLEQPTAEKSRG